MGESKSPNAQTSAPRKLQDGGGILSTLGADGPSVGPMTPSTDALGLTPKPITVCPKCHKAAWRPYLMRVRGKYGATYSYLVYRHPDGRRHTPRKHTVKI